LAILFVHFGRSDFVILGRRMSGLLRRAGSRGIGSVAIGALFGVLTCAAGTAQWT
jgi:hypothetical protein